LTGAPGRSRSERISSGLGIRALTSYPGVLARRHRNRSKAL